MFKIAVILSNIRSLHNVGSILRSADGFGASHIFFAGYTPYPLQPNDTRLPHESRKITEQIHKTALGGELLPASIHATTADAIKAAKEAGYTVVALEQANNSTPLSSFTPSADTALLLGNEVTGILPSDLELVDVILEIPMFGTKESFNVSVSAGIALYQLRLGATA